MSNPYGGYGGNTGGYGQPSNHQNPWGQQAPGGQYGGQGNQFGGQPQQFGGQQQQWGGQQQPGGQFGGQQKPQQFGGQGYPAQYPNQNQFGVQQPGGQFGGQQPPQQFGGQQNFGTPQQNQLRQMIDELFTRYDRDRSGSLDRSELGAVFNEVLAKFNMGFTISQSEAEALLYQIDNNRDGKIGKPELFNCLRNLVINETTKPAVNRW